jgi:hypothetical protein
MLRKHFVDGQRAVKVRLGAAASARRALVSVIAKQGNERGRRRNVEAQSLNHSVTAGAG